MLNEQIAQTNASLELALKEQYSALEQAIQSMREVTTKGHKGKAKEEQITTGDLPTDRKES